MTVRSDRQYREPLRIAVVGGAGFLGRALSADLAAAGHDVHAVDLPHTVGAASGEGRLDDAAAPAAPPLEAATVEDPAQIGAALHRIRPHTVVNLAYLVGAPAERSVALATRVNLAGPMNVLEACRASGVRRYVYASSIAVYGPSQHVWARQVDEADMLSLDSHTSHYGAFKCCNEYQARAFAAESGLDCTGVRLSIVLGPGRTRGLATWASRMLEDVARRPGRHEIPVPAASRSSLLGLPDAVRLLRAVTLAHRTRPIYNSGGHDVSARELTDLVSDLVPGVRFTFDEEASNIPFVHDVANRAARQDLGFGLEPFPATVRRMLAAPGTRGDTGGGRS